MPVSMEFLRGLLGVIGIGCAYMLGRSAAFVRRGWQKKARIRGWALRTALCLGAVAIRHPVDAADIAIWSLSAVAFAAAYWDASRVRPEPEDLTKTMFPGDEK